MVSWHSVKKQPSNIMIQIFRVLKILTCEWQKVSAFRIKVRWREYEQLSPTNPSNNSGDDYCTQVEGKPLTICLQLYRVQQTIYLLDFHKIQGHPYRYMELCSKIISYLQMGLANTKSSTVENRNSASPRKKNNHLSSSAPGRQTSTPRK